MRSTTTRTAPFTKKNCTLQTTIADPMDAGSARDLTDRIKAAVTTAQDLIAAAYHGGAWTALGYSSWDEYVSAEFEPLRLSREERPEVVGALHDAGLSVRAIAAATGSSTNTVQKDVSRIATPEPLTAEEAADLAANEAIIERGLAELKDLAGTDDVNDAIGAAVDRVNAGVQRGVDALSGPARRVTGTDGKSYPAKTPKPAKPRRGPITDDAIRAGWEIRKAVERLERIQKDDRFAANADAIRDQWEGHLQYAGEVVHDLQLDLGIMADRMAFLIHLPPDLIGAAHAAAAVPVNDVDSIPDDQVAESLQKLKDLEEALMDAFTVTEGRALKALEARLEVLEDGPDGGR